MRRVAKNSIGIVLLMGVLLLSSHVLAQEPSPEDQPPDAQQVSAVAVPDLADMIPLAAELSGRLAVLEIRMKDGLDLSLIEQKYATIEANLKGLGDRFQQLKETQELRFVTLVDLKETIEQEYDGFEAISRPLRQAIRQLGAWRTEWLAEQTRWTAWQAALLKEGDLEPLKMTFAQAQTTIDRALHLVLTQLKTMLTVQEQGGTLQTTIQALSAEVEALILARRRSLLVDSSPPMVSSRYAAQFSSKLWDAVGEGLTTIAWPDSRFFAQQGWIVVLQGVLVVVVILVVSRHRTVLNDSERWRFLAARPLSAGVFFATIATVFLYEYVGAPETITLVNTMIGGLAFVRLSEGVLDASWKRQGVAGVMLVLIVTRLLYVVNLPIPLFRLYILIAALLGLLFCVRWARESRCDQDSGLYPRVLRGSALVFAVIMLAELWGKEALTFYLFVSLIDSLATVLVVLLFMHLIRGGVEWLIRISPLRQAAVLHREDTETIIRQLARFINLVIWGLVVLPALLTIWGVYNTLKEATTGVLTWGVTLGSQRISVGVLIVAAGILYGAFFLSWLLRTLLLDRLLLRRRVERGVRLAIERLAHYFIIAVGFLLALGTLGVELTQFTIMLSALSVGIGFGLQGVVNNFFSGLILLFERPIRVGDAIDVNGNRAEITRIGLRSTTVQTLDQTDVILPNADLISNPVTNWTLSSRRVRLSIPVGVAYGSDVPLVMERLMTCATAHEKVANTPAPQVLFLGFGESSLDFTLHVWVVDVDDILKVKSDLHREIDRIFREAQIEIPFPQRDLHLRSVDETVMGRRPEME